MPDDTPWFRPACRTLRGRKTLLAWGWLLAAAMVTASARADDPPPRAPSPAATVVPHRRDDAARYQNFVVNWDAGTDVLCAVVRTPADYARLFHPAPVIGGKKPFAPPDDRFEKEHLLVIARIVGGDGGSELSIDRVVERQGTLEVHGRFKPSSAASSFSIKLATLAWIPPSEADQLTFFENGKPVVTIDAAGGEWISPPLPDAPPAPH